MLLLAMVPLLLQLRLCPTTINNHTVKENFRLANPC